jgi:WD40 repeat protein
MGLLNPKLWAVCRVDVDGGATVASGADSGHVRLWNPGTGTTRKLGRAKGAALALCQVTPGGRFGGRTVVASAGVDHRIWLWDPVAGREVTHYTGHPTERITQLCRLPGADGDLLVTAGHDGLILVLDPATGDGVRVMAANGGQIQGMCRFVVDGADRLATVGLDSLVRIWDATSGELLHELAGHDGWLHAVCPVTVAGRVLVASAGDDQTIRLWNPVTGEQVRAMRPADTLHTASVTASGGGTVYALRALRSGQRVWLATGGDFPGVWLWDPATGRGAGWVGWNGVPDRRPECGWIRALDTYPAGDGPNLLTGGYDKTVGMFAARGTPGFTGF